MVDILLDAGCWLTHHLAVQMQRVSYVVDSTGSSRHLQASSYCHYQKQDGITHLVFLVRNTSSFVVDLRLTIQYRTNLVLDTNTVDVCIIGAGISGLTAAITTAEESNQHNKHPSILVLEADSGVGGRVRSDYTPDGFTLDRGFAVFIEQYPNSKELLDYDALKLAQFLPGARVKLSGRDQLALVSDPLRRRSDILKAITSPVGTLVDKARLAPLIYTVVTKNVDELFSMEETDTLTCLRDKYGFSEEFISSFFAPFFEGIYLTSMDKQSSRMFHFVFKMFTLGSASLPAGGMQAVANQLKEKASRLGADIRCNSAVCSIKSGDSDGGFLVDVQAKDGTMQTIYTKSMVVATDERVARKLLINVDGVVQIPTLPELPQRSVGCIYYALPCPAPLTESILILNGEGSGRRNTKEYPINNVCFPSVVNRGYAPEGFELCSVALLENAITEHGGDDASLDASVRNQLSTWFPQYASDILDETIWVQKGLYNISNAQHAHFNEYGCASVHGGRDSSTLRGVTLPKGVFVCGDHMATSTFNGALESGVNAGTAVSDFVGR